MRTIRPGSLLWGGVLSGSGGLIKSGAGTLILTAANTYSGGTVIKSGTLQENFNANVGAAATNVINSSSALTLGGGTLALVGSSGTTTAVATGTSGATSFTVTSAAGLAVGQSVSGTGIAGGTANGSGVVAGTYITAISGTTITISLPTTAALASTTLTFGTETAAAEGQTFNNTTVGSGLSTVSLTQNGATSLTANLGAITRNTGGVLNFSTIPQTSGIIAMTSTAGTNGILGPWATVGTGTSLAYATVNGSNQIVAYSGGTALPTSGGSATTEYTLGAGTTTETAALTADTIQFNGATAGTLANGGFSLTLNGLMDSNAGGPDRLGRRQHRHRVGRRIGHPFQHAEHRDLVQHRRYRQLFFAHLQRLGHPHAERQQHLRRHHDDRRRHALRPNLVVTGGASSLGNATSAVVINNGGVLNYTGTTPRPIRGASSSGRGAASLTTPRARR